MYVPDAEILVPVSVVAEPVYAVGSLTTVAQGISFFSTGFTSLLLVVPHEVSKKDDTISVRMMRIKRRVKI